MWRLFFASLTLAGCASEPQRPVEMTKVLPARCTQVIEIAANQTAFSGVRFTPEFSIYVDRAKWDALGAQRQQNIVNVQAELTACNLDLFVQPVQVTILDALDGSAISESGYKALN